MCCMRSLWLARVICLDFFLTTLNWHQLFDCKCRPSLILISCSLEVRRKIYPVFKHYHSNPLWCGVTFTYSNVYSIFDNISCFLGEARQRSSVRGMYAGVLCPLNPVLWILETGKCGYCLVIFVPFVYIFSIFSLYFPRLKINFLWLYILTLLVLVPRNAVIMQAGAFYEILFVKSKRYYVKCKYYWPPSRLFQLQQLVRSM